MAAQLENLEFRDRKQLRKWLAAHHASSPGIWVVAHKEHTGVASIPYEDVVREALCWGWIDSLIKRLDDERYARKLTPRKPGSKWSAINRERWRDLERDGLLGAPGRTAAPTDDTYAPKPSIPELPDYIVAAFERNARAWAFFRSLAPSYRRHFVAWIHIAKRPETREKRIREAIALLARGEKLGLK